MKSATKAHRTARSRSGVEEGTTPKLWIAVVALLALFVGVSLGGLIARSTGGSSKASDAAPTVTTTPVVNAAGPSRFDGFVPVGYQRSEAGAVAAAAAYTAMVTELIRRPETEIRAAARSIATPDAAPTVEETLLRPIDGIRSALALAAEENPNGRALVRTVPLGTKLVAYSGDTAQVDVWAMSVVALETVASADQAVTQVPQATFTVTSYSLAWERGDWHVAEYRYAVGVGPTFTRTPAPAATELINEVAPLAPFRYRGNTEVTR